MHACMTTHQFVSRRFGMDKHFEKMDHHHHHRCTEEHEHVDEPHFSSKRLAVTAASSTAELLYSRAIIWLKMCG